MSWFLENHCSWSSCFSRSACIFCSVPCCWLLCLLLEFIISQLNLACLGQWQYRQSWAGLTWNILHGAAWLWTMLKSARVSLKSKSSRLPSLSLTSTGAFYCWAVQEGALCQAHGKALLWHTLSQLPQQLFAQGPGSLPSVRSEDNHTKV